MTDKEMIEECCQQEGFSIQSWKDTDDGVTAVLGNFVATSDDENAGIYEGDEGELTACVVGAKQYNNQAVSFSFVLEGNDEGVDATSHLWSLEPA